MAKRTKILLLGDINSIHLQKWAIGLMDDFEILLFSLDPLKLPSPFQTITAGKIKTYTNKEITSNTKSKVKYLQSIKELRNIYKQFKPDIVHAHYATSYGLLGMLLHSKKFVVSVWGSDIYEFPKSSFMHKWVIQLILKRARVILSTSQDMAKEINLYVNKKITVIPFGIDIEKFKPVEKLQKQEQFIIGTVKSLEDIYGIDRLIQAFALFHSKYPSSNCYIYGQGTKKEALQQLTKELNVENVVLFQGVIDNATVPDVLNLFDVFCALSRRESFGVAVIEASACGLPVVVTNVGGLPEVVIHNKTGFICSGEPMEVAEKFEELYNNEVLRKKLGNEGRKMVVQHFDWKTNIAQMKDVYIKLVK